MRIAEKEMSWSCDIINTTALSSEYWKPCLNLCLRRLLKPSLNLVSNLTLLGLWQLKALLPGGRINFQRLFLKKLKLSELQIFRPNLFHSMTVEGIPKKVMFYIELRNVISIPCVISIDGNGNNVKKVIWWITFINSIEAA